MDNMDVERWKNLPYYLNYEISSEGRVRNKKTGRVLKPSLLKNGYYVVGLCKNGKPKTFYIHVLMGIVFLKHIPDGNNVVIDHKDNIKTNNKLSNLQKITHRKNSSKDISNTSSKYTGVSWNKFHKKWQSRIMIDGKNKHLGYFDNEELAKESYEKKLLTLN